MTGGEVISVVVFVAVVLWFAQGWYLNSRLREVHRKLDRILETFDGLREYLYEIDPQFDEERALMGELHESLGTGGLSFAGMEHRELTRRKELAGQRTLATRF
jgi:hypothetical protein